MTAKTEESHHSTSRERSIQPVTQPSGVGHEEGGHLRPVRGSYDLMDMALRDAGNTLNIASCMHCHPREGLTDISAAGRTTLIACLIFLYTVFLLYLVCVLL